MIKQLQKKYALSQQGAKDLIKGCIACVFQNISFMFPVGLLYSLVSDLMSGNIGGKAGLYAAGDVCGSIEEKDGRPYAMGFDAAMNYGYLMAEAVIADL